MIPRIFSPSVTWRLFDTMPLPRAVRIRKAGRMKAQLPHATRFRNVAFRIKKVPLNA